MNKKFILIAGFLILFLNQKHLLAQTPGYLQFHLIRSLNNPAEIASYKTSTISFIYGVQSFPTNFSFKNPSLHFVKPIYESKYSPVRKGAFSASVINEKAGAHGMFNTTTINIGGAYMMNLSKSLSMSFGLQLGNSMVFLDESKITTSNQYSTNGFDPQLGSGETFMTTNLHILTINSGINFQLKDSDNSQKGNFGVAIFNLNQPSNSFTSSRSKVDYNINLSGSYRLVKQNNLSLAPNFRWRSQDSGKSLMAGVNLRKHARSKGRDGQSYENFFGLNTWVNDLGLMAFGTEFKRKDYLVSVAYGNNVFGGARESRISNTFEVSVHWIFQRFHYEEDPNKIMNEF